MTVVQKNSKLLCVNPIKISQTMGAALAFLGIRNSISLLHGNQGCSAFGKILFIRHFWEPIAMQTTALDHIAAVMDPDANLLEGLATVCKKNAPELVAVLTTGLSEAQGTDLKRVITLFRKDHPQFADTHIVAVNTPDFQGSLETGHAAALSALIDHFVPSDTALSPPLNKKQITVVASHMLTPGDLNECRNIIRRFDLEPIFVSDLGRSLEGFLSPDRSHSTTPSGTEVAKLEHLAASSAVLSIGRSVAACGQTLAQRTRTNAYHFDSLTGMAACDRFLQILSQLSGITPDTEFVRERACLQDALLDTHFYLAGKRMALAGESDLLHAFAPLCQDTSITLSFAVVPTLNDSLSDCFAETVMEGDLEDVEMTLSHNAPVDLVVGNSYLVPVCDFHTLPLYRCGYPVFDRLGATRTCQIGYRGTMDLLFGWANLIWSHHTPHPEVYHSTLNPREDSSNETDQKTPFSTH